MVGAIKFLQYRTIAYWRRAFSVRGKYDSGAGFLVLIILGFAFKYILILNNAAKSLAVGNANDLHFVFGIVFLVWILPVLESQSISPKTVKFLHLPFSKNQFASINLATVFLLPTSILAITISVAAIYPIIFSKNIFAAVFSLFIFALTSAFLFICFFNLLKIGLFRKIAFFSAIILSVIFFTVKTDFIVESEFFLKKITAEIVNSENQFANIFVMLIFFVIVASLAFITSNFVSADSMRRLNPQILSRIKLPLKFGELIKKDFLYSWKILDCYFSLLIAVLYALILIFADFSFQSFSIAISFVVMMSGSLAFNNFGLETASAIERLSLLPIKPENLLAAKNKAFAIVIFSQIFFWFPLLFFKFGAVLTFAAILKTISILLLYTALGNFLSLKYPFKMYFYQLSFGGSISAMLYGILIISSVVVVPEFLTAENVVLKLITNILSVVLCGFIYKLSLSKTSQKLSANWGNIALKLS